MPTEIDPDKFEEIEDSGETWVIDFWAEWCVSPDTVVYPNEATVSAGNLIDSNHSVFSFNQVTDDVERRKISESSINETDSMMRLETETGRELELAGDHEVYTEEGWKKVEKLQKDDRIAVLPVEDREFEFKGGDETILTDSDIEDAAGSKMRVKDYKSQLSDKDLIPLEASDKRVPAIARLTGFLFGDGSLYSNEENTHRIVDFSMGTEEDAEEVRYDLEKLGFSSRLEERKSEFEIDGREIGMQTWRVRNSNTSAFLFFNSLGVPVGKKTDVKYEIPDWIMNSEESVKREFLRGFIGADGPKPSIVRTEREEKGDYNSFVINDLEFHKEASLSENGVKFAEQLRSLFEEFDVEVREIKLGEKFERSDGTKSTKIIIRISDKLESFKNYANFLRPAYCSTKEKEFLRTGEYVNKRSKKHREAKKIKQKSSKLREEGMKWGDIADEVNKKKETIYGWIKYDKQPLPSNEQLYDEWIQERRCDLNDRFIWEEIRNIGSLKGSHKTVSMEIEGTHNYFANGILTHNCGPCKKLAPEFEDASEEVDSVNWGKVDMEEHQELGTENGVRALPTILIIRDGEEVARNTGVMKADELVDWVEENS